MSLFPPKRVPRPDAMMMHPWFICDPLAGWVMMGRLCKFDGWSGVFSGMTPAPQYNSEDYVNLK